MEYGEFIGVPPKTTPQNSGWNQPQRPNWNHPITRPTVNNAWFDRLDKPRSYETPLDEVQSPELSRDNLIHLINNYFDFPTLTKVKILDSGHSIYVTKFRTLLGNRHRYLIVTALDNYELHQQLSLSDITRWKSIQTRELETFYKVPEHSYSKKNMTITIKVSNRSDDHVTYYSPEYSNLTVTLLDKDNSSRSFNDNGTLSTALETFSTVITLI
jgi:hypothetical protein